MLIFERSDEFLNQCAEHLAREEGFSEGFNESKTKILTELVLRFSKAGKSPKQIVEEYGISLNDVLDILALNK